MQTRGTMEISVTIMEIMDWDLLNLRGHRSGEGEEADRV